MQIGDKVRFLNETGGGRVVGFQGRNIVLVKDEDGFDIPMLRSQVVVIDTNANNFEKKKVPVSSGAAPVEETPEPQVSPPHERKGGDLLNVCLAFVPEDSRELSNTRFEAYFINDSNYFVCAVVAHNEGAAWHVRWQGILAPNTKQLIETFDRSILNDLERLSVQLIVWKQDKPYMLKPAVGVELRLDTVKFYKLHVFQPSPFFREPALVYDIVRDDRPVTRKPGVEDPVPREEEEPMQTEVEEQEVQEESPAAVMPPPMTREQEREALKAAKRALKAEQQKQREKEMGGGHTAKEPVIEVDLHINALLDNINGLSPSVLLNTQLTEFRYIMERNIRKKGQRIVFIHGKGEDVLREALLKELRQRYRNCTAEDASFHKYGGGAMMVTIR